MILIYANEHTPRLEYILKLTFEDILKTKFAITTNSSEFRKSELPKLNYSFEKFDDELYLKPHKILFSKAVIYPDFKSAWYKGEKYFFNTSDDSFLPFDPLAASFFLVTRFEEYLETERGKYNCYPADKSILVKYGLLKKPIVNIWAQILSEKIKEKHPEMEFPENKFNFLTTIDIDNAWAFAHKGFSRSIGAFLKGFFKGSWKENSNRVKVWFNSGNDPYDSYSYIDSIYKGHEKNAIFFFLLGNYKKHDKNISYKNVYFQKLIRNVSGKYKVGIHPSYSSSKKSGKKRLSEEIGRLENIIGKRPEISRQHFLRLFFPRTYRNLNKKGISEDYSMGYSSQTGFRAGICTPFNFFDLEKDREINLKIYPFQVMDVTLREYLDLGVEEAKKEIEQLITEVNKVGGTFVGIWHNETLSNMGRWEGYREVFEYMNKRGFDLSNG